MGATIMLSFLGLIALVELDYSWHWYALGGFAAVVALFFDAAYLDRRFNS